MSACWWGDVETHGGREAAPSSWLVGSVVFAAIIQTKKARIGNTITQRQLNAIAASQSPWSKWKNALVNPQPRHSLPVTVLITQRHGPRSIQCNGMCHSTTSKTPARSAYFHENRSVDIVVTSQAGCPVPP